MGSSSSVTLLVCMYIYIFTHTHTLAFTRTHAHTHIIPTGARKCSRTAVGNGVPPQEAPRRTGGALASETIGSPASNVLHCAAAWCTVRCNMLWSVLRCVGNKLLVLQHVLLCSNTSFRIWTTMGSPPLEACPTCPRPQRHCRARSRRLLHTRVRIIVTRGTDNRNKGYE